MANVPLLKEIIIEKNKHLEYSLDLSFLDAEVKVICAEKIYRFALQEASSLALKILSAGDNTGGTRIEVVLQGQGARANIFGCYALTGKAQHSFELVQEHQAPHTTSYSLVQSALTGNADFVYRGIIKIQEEARGADAALYNKNILLSDTAKVVAVPSLEVLTNAVQCKHGTATSSFDVAQLVYLQSRGLSLAASKELLLGAFFIEELGIEQHTRESFIKQLLECA